MCVTCRLRLLISSICFAVCSVTLVHAQPTEIRGLGLGMTLQTLQDMDLYNHACGSNGGPPLKLIDGWGAFTECEADANGLREIYIEFDDELQYIIRATPDLPEDENWLTKFAGTKIAGHPVVLTALLDEAGTVRGLRAVTDPRAELQYRRKAYLLRNPVKKRYEPLGWNCRDLPLAEGETPIGRFSINERCETITNDVRHVFVVTHLYRRPGQDGVDAANNAVEGEFESSTRMEIWDPKVLVALPD